MLTILIVDDNQNKIKDVRKIVEKLAGIDLLETATNIISAKKILRDHYFDLLILDLGLPLRDGDDALPRNGIDFLSEINISDQLIRPSHIIGFSAIDSYIDQFSEIYDSELWALIKYEEDNEEWGNKIINKINYLIKSKQDILNKPPLSYQYDVAIVTALRHPELESLLRLDVSWESFRLNNDSTEYFKGVINKEDYNIKIVAACTPQMGMVAASNLTSKMIHNFRPRYIAMTGIAAGVAGIGNYGDILIADITFDSGSGKIITDENDERIFLPDYRSIDLEPDLKEQFISLKGNRDYLYEIKNKWPINITHELNIHVGPFASGAGVIANKKVIDEIKGHSRKLIGLDMETYGVFYATKYSSKPRPKACFSMKSISDFGDSNKNDNYHEYAAYTSANYLYNFVKDKLNFD